MYELQPIQEKPSKRAPQGSASQGKPQIPRGKSSRGRFWPGFVAGIFAFVTLAALGLALTLVGYAAIARDLPSPSELRTRASTFQSTRIYDREGNLLNETFDPDAGKRIEVPLDRMSQHVVRRHDRHRGRQLLPPPGRRPGRPGPRRLLCHPGTRRGGRRLDYYAAAGQTRAADARDVGDTQDQGGDPRRRDHAPLQQERNPGDVPQRGFLRQHGLRDRRRGRNLFWQGCRRPHAGGGIAARRPAAAARLL